MAKRKDGVTCTAKAKTTGKRCGNAPMRGGTVCKFHGGKAPQVEQSAKRRLMAAADPAAARLIELLDASDDRVVLAAARDLLDRAGLKAPTVVQGEISIESAVAVVEEEIKARQRLYDELPD